MRSLLLLSMMAAALVVVVAAVAAAAAAGGGDAAAARVGGGDGAAALPFFTVLLVAECNATLKLVIKTFSMGWWAIDGFSNLVNISKAVIVVLFLLRLLPNSASLPFTHYKSEFDRNT
uniref:Ion transport domain-containing protein n=1 Tax=Glossina austeni TaxID=7395 RepID=A0A1A9VWV2_GLOAU